MHGLTPSLIARSATCFFISGSLALVKFKLLTTASDRLNLDNSDFFLAPSLGRTAVRTISLIAIERD
jgi:hypothetical protein